MNLHDPDQFRKLWEQVNGQHETTLAEVQPPQGQGATVPGVHREVPLGDTDVLDRRTEG